MDYLSAIGMEQVRAHERDLTTYALERLPEVDGLTLYGPPDVDARGGVVAFAIEGIHPHDIAELCDREAVCVRAGHHCAQPLMRRARCRAPRPAPRSTSTTRVRTWTAWCTPCSGAREVFG